MKGDKMTTTVHKVLGARRVEEICDNDGLNADDKKIMGDILKEWEDLGGKREEKVSIVLEILKNNPNSNPFKIYKALADISLEFAAKSLS